MTEKEIRFIKKWEEKRTNKWKFCIMRGLIRAVIMFVLLSAIYIYYMPSGKGYRNIIIVYDISLLVIVFVFGIINGAQIFKKKEKLYQELLKVN